MTTRIGTGCAASELPPELRRRVEPAVRSGHRFLINRTGDPVGLGIDGFLPPRGVQIIPR
ncbi:hypothetical protein [Actinoplanes palleronii]|uniref:Uncharacterized protein n=1 Tax=Actinoplanes palleronii TaxID=113570 RepID=A0ABQ4B0P0_9ACTN|nr:hypothetical protein [Actinoplanes palleronii]GIE64046.1 hypothetical protein Apa02nite_001540 [Actinoplanes palleronii]